MPRADLPSPFLHTFDARLQGELICPGDARYDQARRVWNGRFDRYPALIVCCANTSDVIMAVRFAREHDLPIAVRSGGHSAAGYGTCDGGLVIDVTRMKGIHIHPDHCTARVEPGLTGGELLDELQVFGQGAAVGIFSGIGISGLTLGGGIGWLTGKYGLTCDNLRAAEIVTADGKLLKTSAVEHSDLFWALRGGGGNFGVVTSLEFQLHPVAQVMAGMVVYPSKKAREVLRFYREYSQGSPDELTITIGLGAGLDGQSAVSLLACYCGSLDDGEQVLAPLRTLGQPHIDMLRPMTLRAAHSSSEAVCPAGRPYYYRAETLPGLCDEAIDVLIEYADSRTSPFSLIGLQHFHGAACRIRPEATAFALRHEHYILEIVAAWETGDGEEHIDWVRRFRAAIKPFTREGVYPNFLGEEGEARIRASYGNNYTRLQQVKSAYDRYNAFHLNQNIRPATHSFLTSSL